MGVRSLSTVLVLAACGAKTASPPPAPTAPAMPDASLEATLSVDAQEPVVPPGPVSNATLAEAGVEAASLDRTADPCVDFYQFACGGWLATNQIPPALPSWNRFAELAEKNRTTLIGILDEVSKTPGNKLGDFYASCMDEATIEKAGIAGIKPLLDKARGAKDAKSWVTAVTELHKSGIGALWTAYADADLDDATRNITWLDPIGLGLPDRDYYLDTSFADTVAKYKQHVERMLGLAGVANPAAAASDVVTIETALASHMKTRTERRDIKKLNNIYDLKKLAKDVPVIDWKAYFKALGVTPSARIGVTEPAYFSALIDLRKQFKPAQWSSYFAYQLLIDTALALPKAFDNEAFELQKIVNGSKEMRPRDQRCERAVATSLGELLGKEYVDRYFSADAKAAAKDMFDAVAKAMGEQIGAADWMSDATKKIARDKLSKIVPMVGYPAKWRTYNVTVKRDDFAGNFVRAKAFEYKRVLAKSGKPYDRGEWTSNAFDVNLFYNPNANNAGLIAGTLQPPFFGAKRSVAANLGAIGMGLGHELTHAFDDEGALFDAEGNMKDWWTPADKTAFDGRAACVADQYSTYEVLPQHFVNGKLTLGENIADLGGAKMAFNAYRMLRAGADPIIADGFTEDQIFFISAAQLWCTKDRPEAVLQQITADPHTPAKFRVYGALRNLPAFAQAFSCAAGTPMRPTQACSVW